MAILRLTEQIAQQIREHGASDYPNETCGAMLGTDREDGRAVLALVPLTNRRDDSPRNRFSITAEDFRVAERAAAEQGLEVVGWYHSHPDHPARPSEFDREHAWPWYSYVIVSVDAGRPQLMTSWLLAEDRSHFDPEEIVTRESASSAT
ncbi:MAG: M67 family metallopeptidase [Candidatus Acidiferrales bacterium]|jgi:proteasome lid subunit RPN8/RPN11